MLAVGMDSSLSGPLSFLSLALLISVTLSAHYNIQNCNCRQAKPGTRDRRYPLSFVVSFFILTPRYLPIHFTLNPTKRNPKIEESRLPKILAKKNRKN
jgi:hypothetical protein